MRNIIRKINKKRAIVFCSAVIILFILLMIFSAMKKSQSSQTMADRWSSDGTKYAQISIFYPDDKNLYSTSEVENIETAINEKMDSESYKPVREGAEVWIDAYSTVPFKTTASGRSASDQSMEKAPMPEMSGEGDNEKKEFSETHDVNLVGIGGDYFEFHPLELLSGNYIYEGEFRDNRAVLDEESAWALFSSADVVGMKFYAADIEFEVAGVVRHEAQKVTSLSYPETPIIYVHSNILKVSEINDSILCYEAVIPDPVENYAKNIILEYYGVNMMSSTDDAVKKGEENLPCIIIDNTNRYSSPKLWQNIKDFGKNLVISKQIVFPYWENAARIMTARLSLVFLTIVIVGAAVIIMVLIFIGKLYLNRTWHLKDYIEKLTDKYTYKKKMSDYINVNEDDEGKEKKYE